MTLYVPLKKDGQRALPCASATEANLFILRQSDPRDWIVELVAGEDETQAQAKRECDAAIRIEGELDRSLDNAVAYGRHFDAFLGKLLP